MTRLLIAPLAALAVLAGSPAATLAAPPPVAVRQDTTPQDIYNFMTLCMAADILTSQDTESSPQRTEEGTMVYNMLMRAGALVNKTEDDMVEDVAGLAAMWNADAELMRESPPETIRQQCIETIRSLG